MLHTHVSGKLSEETLEVAADVILINIDLRAHVISFRRFYRHQQAQEECEFTSSTWLSTASSISLKAARKCSPMSASTGVMSVLCSALGTYWKSAFFSEKTRK